MGIGYVLRRPLEGSAGDCTEKRERRCQLRRSTVTKCVHGRDLLETIYAKSFSLQERNGRSRFIVVIRSTVLGLFMDGITRIGDVPTV